MGEVGGKGRASGRACGRRAEACGRLEEVELACRREHAACRRGEEGGRGQAGGCRQAHAHTLEPGQDKQVGGKEQDRPQREQREGRAGGRY